MRFRLGIALFAAGILAIGGFVSCDRENDSQTARTSTPANAPIPPASSNTPDSSVSAEEAVLVSVPRIGVEDARSAVDQGGAVLVDVRDAESFAAGHPPGAVHLPFEQFLTGINGLPGDRMIITYCT